MKKRPHKKKDQTETEKAYQLLCAFVKKHPEIEESLWAGALMSAFINMHQNAGFSFGDFSVVLLDVKQHYKEWYFKEKTNE